MVLSIRLNHQNKPEVGSRALADIQKFFLTKIPINFRYNFSYF